MMVWVTDSGKIDKERLEPLGLICYELGKVMVASIQIIGQKKCCGSSGKPFLGEKKNNGEMTYHVYNEDKSFDYEISYEDFKNIDKVYKAWKTKYRKEKINKIENG